MSVKKNVLLVINSDLVNAGVPNVVMVIVRNLSKYFNFDIVVYHNQDGQYDDEFKSYGGKIFRLSLLDYKRHKILYPLRYVQIGNFIKKILKQKKYDIIHCHNGIESGIFLKYAHLFEIPTRIAHAHGTYLRKGNNKILLWYRLQCKKLIQKNLTVAVACSTQAGKSLFDTVDFINILNPVSISSYLDLEKKQHTGCNLLQIGYFCANKNQIFSIKLLKKLLEKKMDVKLSFVGFPQDEVYYAEMLRLIDELSLNENVKFLPSNIDKSQVFSDIDIVLVPSFTEGLPLVALEAQAAHIMTLMSDHVTLDANIGLGFYAKYNDFHEWENAINEMYCEKSNYSQVNIDTDLIETNSWCNRIGAIYYGE